MKAILIQSVSTHYRVKLYEELHKIMNIKFLFFSDGKEKYGGKEKYWDGFGGMPAGNFQYQYLKVIDILPHFRFNPELWGILRKEKPDVIIKGITGVIPLIESWLFARFHRIPFILWTGLWRHPRTLFHIFTFLIVRYIYQTSSAIITYGSHVSEYLAKLGVDSNKIFEAWQTVDNNKFNIEISKDDLENLKSKYKLRKKVILFVGRLTKSKGLEYLIDAFVQLNNSDLSLVIIGRGKLRVSLQKRVQILTDRHIVFIDYVPNDELVKYYALADIFVSPSITTRDFKEPWGLTVNEVMNQGVPVIVSDAFGAGVGGLLQNGINGFVVPERNSGALKEKMNYLLLNDSIRKKMGESARKEITKWTYARMAEGFVKAINHCLSK